MSSILTNVSASTALQNLSATQNALTITEGQISTGLRVSTASEDAAYWSIATTMRANASGTSALIDSLGLVASVVSVASDAVNGVLSVLDRIKGDLVTADQPGASLADVQSDIVAQQRALLSIVQAASFGGVNLLDGSQGSSTSFMVSTTGLGESDSREITINTRGLAGNFNPIVGPSFTNPSPGVEMLGTSGFLTHQLTDLGPGNYLSGSVAGKQVNANGSILYNSSSILSIDITNASSRELTLMQTGVETLIGEVTNAGAQLGTASSIIANQQSYLSALSDAMTSGVSSLVDADMNMASTRLRALQIQQQLGIQALSIANENSQLILKLFQAA